MYIAEYRGVYMLDSNNHKIIPLINRQNAIFFVFVE